MIFCIDVGEEICIVVRCFDEGLEEWCTVGAAIVDFGGCMATGWVTSIDIRRVGMHRVGTPARQKAIIVCVFLWYLIASSQSFFYISTENSTQYNLTNILQELSGGLLISRPYDSPT